jgi:hypothetical protein
LALEGVLEAKEQTQITNSSDTVELVTVAFTRPKIVNEMKNIGHGSKILAKKNV